MKIVINIPDDEIPKKQEYMEIGLHFIDGTVCECTYPFLVLPKRHGRLIDADKLNRKKKYCFQTEHGIFPNKAYELLKRKSELDNIAESIIANGIPLPEGHEDLIDRDYFIDKYAGCGSVYCEDISCNECNSRIVNKFDVDNAPAIIPADK